MTSMTSATNKQRPRLWSLGKQIPDREELTRGDHTFCVPCAFSPVLSIGPLVSVPLPQGTHVFPSLVLETASCFDPAMVMLASYISVH